MKRATLTSSPPSPSRPPIAEDIALHPQLGVLRAQRIELLDVTGGQALRAVAGLPGPSDPVAQSALVDAQVPSHLGDRLPRRIDHPDRSLAELPVVPLADSGGRHSLRRQGDEGLPPPAGQTAPR